MSYKIILSPEAEDDLKSYVRSGNKSVLKKIATLISELKEHPTTGTGKPEQLKGDRGGQWSRRITDKHRLIYCIDENAITVAILSACGHYNDK